jgi:ribosomal protein S18 acetylase RimI-like enzyme
MQTTTIRPMRHSDITRCVLIEQEAARQFGTLVPDPAETLPRAAVGHAIEDGLAWVAVDLEDGDTALGFLVARADPGEDLYVAELDVHPSCQGRGLGSALLLAAEATARRDGYRRMVLTTFRDIPWNAPWYEKRGFTILPEPKGLTAALQARLTRQRDVLRGARVAMAKPL